MYRVCSLLIAVRLSVLSCLERQQKHPVAVIVQLR